VLNDTWYSRDLPVLTAIAEKLERGSAPVDTEQLIDELGLTRQDLTAALRALDVEYLIVRWPERITYRRSDPSRMKRPRFRTMLSCGPIKITTACFRCPRVRQ